MANERDRNQGQPGQNDTTRGERDERIRGVGDEDTDEFDEDMDEEDEAEEEEDDGSV